MSTNLKDRIELQKAENEAKRLENEAKRLEIEMLLAKKPNSILRLTTKEWIEATRAGGGCAWTVAVLALLA